LQQIAKMITEAKDPFISSFMPIKYFPINAISKYGKDYFYLGKEESFSFYDYTVSLPSVPGSTKGEGFAPEGSMKASVVTNISNMEVERSIEKAKLIKYVDDPTKLLEILQLHKIKKRHHKTILKKAIKYHFQFPQEEKLQYQCLCY
jgi:hypothetical protein